MCSWVMSRGELAPEGFEETEWHRFDTLCEGLEGFRRRTFSCVLRAFRLRRTASVRESVLT